MNSREILYQNLVHEDKWKRLLNDSLDLQFVVDQIGKFAECLMNQKICIDVNIHLQ